MKKISYVELGAILFVTASHINLQRYKINIVASSAIPMRAIKIESKK